MPAPRRTRHQPEVRKALVFEKAIQIIGRRGYNGFTVQELAEECGLTNGGLLYHFGSKDQILIELLEARDQAEAEAIRSMTSVSRGGQDGQTPSLKMVLAALRAITSRNSKQPELVRLYAMLRVEALGPEHPAQSYFVRREAAILDWFTGMVKPYSRNPKSTARQIVALMNGLEEQWLRFGQDFSMVAEWDRAIAKILPPP